MSESTMIPETTGDTPRARFYRAMNEFVSASRALGADVEAELSLTNPAPSVDPDAVEAGRRWVKEADPASFRPDEIEKVCGPMVSHVGRPSLSFSALVAHAIHVQATEVQSRPAYFAAFLTGAVEELRADGRLAPAHTGPIAQGFTAD